MALDRRLPPVLNTIVEGISQDSSVVLARIWLVKKGDLCETCRFESDCTDKTRCLHLVASAGNSRDPQIDYRNLSGLFKRVPLASRKIGRVASTGEPLLISDIRGHEEWLADTDWAGREGVRAFAAHPLIYRGEVLGVLAIFNSSELIESDFNWLRVLANHAAVTIANANAFEEIDRLRKQLGEENNYLRREISAATGRHNLIGRNAGLQAVMREVELVAKTGSTVLLTGESGTGKELIARAIHEMSPRRNQPLIKVNCGAIPENLFESEFFGHVRGAFTGAIKNRPGRFELADGGTLFLDEIGEVPLSMQVKLLRVLQEREFERVGDTRSCKVNVRVVASTNRDLQREVEAGSFRQDLFYRLSVFPITVPPLRERQCDILPLAEYFARRSAERLNYSVPQFDKLTCEQLLEHTWPGNVRELHNVIERAVILSEGRTLQVQLPPRNRASAQVSSGPGARSITLLTRQELKAHERDNILAALMQTRGKVFGPRGAAVLLGMKPTTLATRIKTLGLNSVAAP